ncbi:MAG: rhamnulokinase [Planctomycetaceae bacterium]|jgi:rhamnulokinase|nr:rhamnulokinase [Planctomycetaceae bacterium]
MPHKYLAVDMGASSGRHVVGLFDGAKLTLEEVYRFENGPMRMRGSYYWNILGQWSHIQAGLEAAGVKAGRDIVSVGVDTWGVDFALLGRGDTLLGNPSCYRDPRTDGAMEKAFETVPRDEIFANTGLQFMQFNTLYQFLAMKWADSPLLDIAETFLMMPDFFHWLLSGVKSNEMTDATTTQMFDPQKNDWAFRMLKKFSLPTTMLQKCSSPGTILGTLRESVAQSTGLQHAKVVLPGTHDTASAVMAVPTASAAGATDWCYISLGTWALMGIESPGPIVNDIVSGFNFTNEGGVGGTTRLLKNISGLWLIQECRRTWNQQGAKNSSGMPLDWKDLNLLSAAAKPLQSFINPDARDFLSPTDMPEAIRSFCKRTGQTIPETNGAVLRCALESIAMKFRHVLEMCEKISGNKIETIHIVGGGTKNSQLCQAAADATGRRVVAGPIEATAIGNIMMQAVALGEVKSIQEARAVIRNSFDVIEFEPTHEHLAHWNDAYERFLTIGNF